MNRSEIVKQTKNAFDYIQKLYFEVSYLIKEVEGLLSQEEEKFVIGRPSGYAVTNRKSNGLEPSQINLWLVRKMSVFFVPETITEHTSGVTITKFEKNPRILYMRIVLDDANMDEPFVYFGVLHDFTKPEKSRYDNKIEPFLAEIEYSDTKVFVNDDINFENQSISIKGELFRVKLFEINSSQDVMDKLIEPGLKLFRKHTN